MNGCIGACDSVCCAMGGTDDDVLVELEVSGGAGELATSGSASAGISLALPCLAGHTISTPLNICFFHSAISSCSSTAIRSSEVNCIVPMVGVSGDLVTSMQSYIIWDVFADAC